MLFERVAIAYLKSFEANLFVVDSVAIEVIVVVDTSVGRCGTDGVACHEFVEVDCLLWCVALTACHLGLAKAFASDYLRHLDEETAVGQGVEGVDEVLLFFLDEFGESRKI